VFTDPNDLILKYCQIIFVIIHRNINLRIIRSIDGTCLVVVFEKHELIKQDSIIFEDIVIELKVIRFSKLQVD
jgi:hypothetical protein